MGQVVLTWYATGIVETFNGDIGPFLNEFSSMTSLQEKYPVSTDYLGYLALGSEAYWSPDAVTFNVPQLSIDIEQN